MRKITSLFMYVLVLFTLLPSIITFQAVSAVTSYATLRDNAKEAGLAYSEAPTSQDMLETIISQINETQFAQFNSIMTNTIGPRPYDSVGNTQAAEFIADEFSATKSIFATYQWFTYENKQIANVIGTLPSANPKNQSKIVVGAHFDTVSNSSGVDDNGSGTALLLEVARVLSRFRFNCTIEFVAFNAEEVGLVGSRYYVQQASQAGEDILLAINVDMCIWDNPDAPPNEKLWIVYQGTVPYDDCERFADATLNISYTYTTAPIQKISSTNNTYVSIENWRRSDQANFWDAGIPALWIYEFNGFQNPYMHTQADSTDAENYNFTLGTEAARVVAATVAKLATLTPLDLTPPILLITSPSAGSTMGSSNVTVTWIGLDTDSGIDYYGVNLDEGSWIEVGTASGYTFVELADGSHTVHVRAFDKASNWKEVYVSFTVDTTPPILSISYPSSGLEISSSTIIVTWSGSDSIVGIDHFEVKLDEGPWINVGKDISYTFTELNDGSHTVHVKAVDKAGNSVEELVDFTVNTKISPPIWVLMTALVPVSIILAAVVYFLRKRKSPAHRVDKIN